MTMNDKLLMQTDSLRQLIRSWITHGRKNKSKASQSREIMMGFRMMSLGRIDKLAMNDEPIENEILAITCDLMRICRDEKMDEYNDTNSSRKKGGKKNKQKHDDKNELVKPIFDKAYSFYLKKYRKNPGRNPLLDTALALADGDEDIIKLLTEQRAKTYLATWHPRILGDS